MTSTNGVVVGGNAAASVVPTIRVESTRPEAAGLQAGAGGVAAAEEADTAPETPPAATLRLCQYNNQDHECNRK